MPQPALGIISQRIGGAAAGPDGKPLLNKGAALIGADGELVCRGFRGILVGGTSIFGDQDGVDAVIKRLWAPTLAAMKN